MSEIRDNLRRILNIQDIEDNIKALQNKVLIPSVNSVTTQTGANGLGVGGSVDGTIDSSNGGQGGAVVDPTGNTSKSASDLFGPGGAKIGSTLDQLKDIYDCETGQQLKLSPNGKYENPNGFEDGGTTYEGYVEGVYWVADNYKPASGASVEQVLKASVIGYTVASGGGSPGYTITSVDSASYSIDGLSASVVGTGQFNYPDRPDLNGPGSISFQAHGVGCTSEGEALCPASPPKKSWPTGQATQLALKDGRFQANEAQTDAAGKYKDGMQSNVDFCFNKADGSVGHGTMAASSDGGALLYQTDGNGAILGNAYHYNTTGILDASIAQADIGLYSA